MKRKHIVLLGIGVLLAGCGARAAVGFPSTHHAFVASTVGTASRTASLEAVVDQPGPVTVETVVGCDWVVPRSGLINLDNPKAIEAGLKDGDEPIIVAFHAVRHPQKGLFLVDTGVERALRDDPDHAAARGFVAHFMHLEKMRFRQDTASWLAAQPDAPAGVFLTHLHLDHVSGLRDVPAGTPVYVGPGEASHRATLNWFTDSVADDALEGKPPLREWAFSPDPDGAFEGVIDVFGDGTFWALHVPGHTSGSTAFLARTPAGPVLLTGDASHTAWGWEHGVEPGSFSEDRAKSASSLARLRRLVERHPGIEVRPGHQVLERKVATR
jgi:N-acyl homoserine lactone hydrolase